MSADRHARYEVAGAYVAQHLDPAECEEFEDHLRGCEQCREDVDALRSVVDVVSLCRPVPSPPAGLIARVLERVRAEPERGPAEFEPVTAKTSAGDEQGRGDAPPPTVRFAPAEPERRHPSAARIALAVLAAVLLLGLAVLVGTQIGTVG